MIELVLGAKRDAFASDELIRTLREEPWEGWECRANSCAMLTLQYSA
jgi:hypothetical protein